MPNSLKLDIKYHFNSSQKVLEYERRINKFDHSFTTVESKKDQEQNSINSMEDIYIQSIEINDKVKVCSEICFSEFSSLNANEKKDDIGNVINNKGATPKVRICNKIEVIYVESFKRYNKQNTYICKNNSNRCKCNIF